MGRTPLHYAAALNDRGHVYNLLKKNNADDTITDQKGHTPPIYLKSKGKLRLQKIQQLVDTLIRLPVIQVLNIQTKSSTIIIHFILNTISTTLNL